MVNQGGVPGTNAVWGSFLKASFSLIVYFYGAFEILEDVRGDVGGLVEHRLDATSLGLWVFVDILGASAIRFPALLDGVVIVARFVQVAIASDFIVAAIKRLLSDIFIK